MRRLLPPALLLLATGCAPSKTDAYAACQRFVRAKLSFAGSAVFPPLDDPDIAVRPHYNSGYSFVGYVDAANGFGALRRVTYRCTTTKRESGEWFRVSLQVGDALPEYGRDLD